MTRFFNVGQIIRKSLWVLLAAPGLVLAGAQELPVDAWEQPQGFGAWEARLVHINETSAIARLTATDELFEQAIMLDFDSSSRFWIYVFTMLSPAEIASWGDRADSIDTELRVDLGEPYVGKWERRVEGKSLLKRLEAELGADFLVDLAKGRRLKVTDSVNGRTFVTGFPLDGFEPALVHAAQRLADFRKAQAKAPAKP